MQLNLIFIIKGTRADIRPVLWLASRSGMHVAFCWAVGRQNNGFVGRRKPNGNNSGSALGRCVTKVRSWGTTGVKGIDGDILK